MRSAACVWLAGLVAASLALATAARAADCPGDGCPYAGVAVVGEGARGVFRFAQALALSPDGQRVYVADTGSYRIQAFTRQGAFLRQWGRYGTGTGELRAIGGLATDAAGRVHVLDSNNDRVQVFSPDGGWLGAWGSRGTAPGQFDLGSNGGLAIDGTLAYVADLDNHRVQRFALDPDTGLADTDPARVLTWGSYGDCATSCTPLTFHYPQGIAVSTAPGAPHDVFVADDDNHRVLKFDANGAPLGAIDAPGELGYPYDVGVDSTHALYVVDNCDPRFEPVCTYTTTGGRPDLTHQRVRKYDAGTLAFLGTWGVFGDEPGQFEFPRAAAAVTADPAGGVYVAEAANNRVQAFDASGRFLRAWGVSGRGPGFFTRPAAVAADAAGDLYVADWGSDRVQQLDAEGRYLGEWGRRSVTGYPQSGSGPGEFDAPAGVAVGADGTVYVGDTGNDRVQARDPGTGAWRTLGGVTLAGPRGLALDGAGHLYVADTRASQVRVLDLATGAWSTVGGSFLRPRAVAVGPAGELYVADTGNDRVQVRAPGASTWTTLAATVAEPAGVAVDRQGRLLVADSGGDRVLRFDARGAPDGVTGTRGTAPGELVGPAGIAVDAGGRVLVTDEFNNRVQIFTPAGEPVPAPPAPPERPTTAPGPSGASAAAVRSPAPLTLTATTTKGVRALLRGGLRVRLTCSENCLVRVRAELSAADARRLRLSRSRRPLAIATHAWRLERLRARIVVLTAGRHARALRRASRLHVRLVVGAVDAAGRRARVERRLTA